MARFYVSADRDQQFLLPVSMRDWLDEGHLAWFVIDVVEAVDTTAFHARHANDGVGRPAYDPDMMLALLFYAYCVGVRSSRAIEAACRTDAAYKLICGGLTPDHATIARFVVDHESAIEAVFVEVLRLCAAEGLVAAEETIALDGTKIAANAALDMNRGREWIRAEVRRLLDETVATDAEAPGLTLMDDGPLATLGPRTGRVGRLQAALAQLDAADAARRAAAEVEAEAAHAAAAEGRKLNGRKPVRDPRRALARAEADVEAVHTAAAAARAARAARRRELEARWAAEGTSPSGPAPVKGYTGKERRSLERAEQRLAAARAAVATTGEATANVVDPDSRVMKTRTAWLQGFNAQAAVNRNQMVVACGVTQDAGDVNQYVPMVAAAQAMLAMVIGVLASIRLVLADAGYWSEANAIAPGPTRLIATLKDWKQRRAARELGTTTGEPPEAASPHDAMEHRLRTADGAAAYAERSWMVEPVYSYKHNRHFGAFRRRGLSAVRSEWSLMNTTNNLRKLHAHVVLSRRN